uniref:Uncharacterized protein n=1 Tax=Amphimedon queenslandica TaxID=400682 RepID=A0A1X7SRJ6_AMPQE
GVAIDVGEGWGGCVCDVAGVCCMLAEWTPHSVEYSAFRSFHGSSNFFRHLGCSQQHFLFSQWLMFQYRGCHHHLTLPTLVCLPSILLLCCPLRQLVRQGLLLPLVSLCLYQLSLSQQG